MAALTVPQRAFLRDNPFVGTVTTLREDGSPHSTVVWVDATDDVVRFNTARGHAKARHLESDQRVSVAMIDPQDAFKWVSVSGTAAVTEEGADAHIDALAKKYLGADSYPFRNPAETRVIVTIKPEHVDSAGFDTV
ncbi:MAG: PPOX class F420-dependent oxidoreductase [Gaiella sp.]